jgi:hypothetical protein
VEIVLRVVSLAAPPLLTDVFLLINQYHARAGTTHAICAGVEVKAMIKIEHRPYDDLNDFSQHDARAVLLNARAYLMQRPISESVYEAFLLLGKAFDRVWSHGPGYIQGSY